MLGPAIGLEHFVGKIWTLKDRDSWLMYSSFANKTISKNFIENAMTGVVKGWRQEYIGSKFQTLRKTPTNNSCTTNTPKREKHAVFVWKCIPKFREQEFPFIPADFGLIELDWLYNACNATWVDFIMLAMLHRLALLQCYIYMGWLATFSNCVLPSGFPQVSRRLRLSVVGQLSRAARSLKLVHLKCLCRRTLGQAYLA